MRRARVQAPPGPGVQKQGQGSAWGGRTPSEAFLSLPAGPCPPFAVSLWSRGPSASLSGGRTQGEREMGGLTGRAMLPPMEPGKLGEGPSLLAKPLANRPPFPSARQLVRESSTAVTWPPGQLLGAGWWGRWMGVDGGLPPSHLWASGRSPLSLGVWMPPWPSRSACAH